MGYKKFIFHWTYGCADSIRDMVVNGAPGFVTAEDFFRDEGVSFLEKASHPNKVTLLHDYIEENVYQEVDYYLRKTPDEMLSEIFELCKRYDVTLRSEAEFRLWDDYIHHVITFMKRKILCRLSNEVFTLLYQDREFLREFNIFSARFVATLNYDRHQSYLSRDGVVKRPNYWPGWLRKGVFLRDRGRCVVCLCDLTGVLYADYKLNIDHIVPLAQGGSNDPTNLQLLCGSCNGEKGGSQLHTGFQVPLYW